MDNFKQKRFHTLLNQSFIRPILLLGFLTLISTMTYAQDHGHSNVKDFKLIQEEGAFYLQNEGIQDSTEWVISINGATTQLFFLSGKATINLGTPDKKGKLFFISQNHHHRLYHVARISDQNFRIKNIPLWLSIIPPALAILLALLFREVIMSLFIGVLSGAFIAGGLRFESIYFMIQAFFSTVSFYLVETMSDSDHLSVIIFSLFIGGMVAVISRNGGMAGVVKALSKYAKTPASTQFITWLIGVAIFFDDYANTLIVGNTMRNISDRFRISREKLAYIVDSTAAPVASIAFVTTWIGAELGYIADGIVNLEGFPSDMTPYSVFLHSLKYAYYPILTLIFILLIIFLKRDYGPMYKAELRARTSGRVSAAIKGIDDEPDMEDISPVEGIEHRWYNAVIPVSLVIMVTILALLSTGMEESLSLLLEQGISHPDASWSWIWSKLDQLDAQNQNFMVKLGVIIGNADSFAALIWGSLTGLVAAIILTQVQRIMKIQDSFHSLLTGFKTIMPALVILCLAWSLAITTGELHTADFITSALYDSVNPYFMPLIIFILSALIAFSTGSSWSTMAILFPIAIPATWAISMAAGLDASVSLELLLNAICGILGASVLGDHVSPISDTTILSSLASDCNHLDHVKTQMPYALTVGTMSMISITVAAYWGGNLLSNGFILLVNVAILFMIVKYLGKRLPENVMTQND